MNGIREDKYSICSITGLNVCEIFDGMWVREDGRINRPKARTKGWFTGQLYTSKDRRWKTIFSYSWLRITYNYKSYQVHRLIAKAFISNYREDLLIDHINGNPLDNRLTNLRCVTNRENQLNQYKHRYGKLAGTNLIKHTGKYQARCKIAKKLYHIGTFPTEQEAHEAYVKFKQERNLS